MKMQCDLIRQLAARFRAPKYVTTPSQIMTYKAMVEDWMAGFPPVYAFENPDRSSDEEHPWIPFHRYYLYTMAYLLIGNPCRAFMAQVYNRLSDPENLEIRKVGIYYSLRQIANLKEWIDHITRRDGRFHFIIFSILDTGAVLCTALINDADRTIPADRRLQIYDAIDDAVMMLKRITTLSITAKTAYEVLSRLAQRVPQKPVPLDEAHRKKRNVATNRPQTLPEMAPGVDSGISSPEVIDQMSQLFQYGHISNVPGTMNTYSVGSGSSTTLSSDGFVKNEGIAQSLDGSVSSISPQYSFDPVTAAPPPLVNGADQIPVETHFIPGLGYGTISDAELAEIAGMWDQWHVMVPEPYGAPHR